MTRRWRLPSRRLMCLAVVLATPLALATPADAKPAPYISGVSKTAHPSSYTWGGGQQGTRYGALGSWELDVTVNGWPAKWAFQSDGNWVLTANGHVVWASGTNGRVSSSGYLEFADNGSIRIHASNGGQVIWSNDRNGGVMSPDYFEIIPSLCSNKVEFVKGSDSPWTPLWYPAGC